MARYPWGHAAPREHLRRVRQNALQALNGAKYDGYDQISPRLREAGREAKPLVDCLTHLRDSGLRPQGTGNTPVPTEAINEAINGVLNTIPGYASSNYGNVKDNFDLFASATYKAIELAQDIVEHGAVADESNDGTQLWKPFDT